MRASVIFCYININILYQLPIFLFSKICVAEIENKTRSTCDEMKTGDTSNGERDSTSDGNMQNDGGEMGDGDMGMGLGEIFNDYNRKRKDIRAQVEDIPSCVNMTLMMPGNDVFLEDGDIIVSGKCVLTRTGFHINKITCFVDVRMSTTGKCELMLHRTESI